MIVRFGVSLVFLYVIFIPQISLGQNVFSEKELDIPKSFLPYDVPYTFALEDKQFIQLIEVKSNVLKIGRYDQYFFEQWEKEIEFNKSESAPQMYLRGDTIFLYSFTANLNKGIIMISFRLFDLGNGEEMPGNKYEIQMLAKESHNPKLSFSPDNRKFIVYNYLASHEGSQKATFTVFEIGKNNAIAEYYLEAESISASASSKAHLSDNGDVFFVSIEAGDYKVHAYFISNKFQEVNEINNNFFFERPIHGVGEINIVRQGASSYFTSFTSKFEDELVGFNVASYNVILKTVMFSYNQNLRKDEIERVYSEYYTLDANQKKKSLEVPGKLENFRMVRSIVNPENDIILIFEEVEIPTGFFQNGNNMPWNARVKKDKYYVGGDLLLYCFSAGGELLWQKCIQKTQFSQASGQGLSFIERVENENLHLLMYESSDGGSAYIITINMLDGSIVNTLNLLPDKKFEFTKKYSCWLNGNSVLICGIAPANLYNRSLMLVEF